MGFRGRNNCYRCGSPDHYIADCPVVLCKECGKEFSYYDSLAANENSCKMHMVVHKPRNIGCPRKVLGGSCCSKKQFRSAADATAHIENGGCGQGREKGKKEVYEFTKINASHLLNKAIGYEGGCGGGRPEYPYKCGNCPRLFKKASSLTQHSDATGHGVRVY